MNDLFLCLFANLKNHGEVTTAAVYDETLSTITVKTNEGTYTVSITKKEKLGEI